MVNRLRFGIGLLFGLAIVSSAIGAIPNPSVKAAAARLSGTWLVAPGEILTGICHNFAPHQPILARKCVRDFTADNPRHLRPDAPDKLAVGVVLLVPASLRLTPTSIMAATAADAKIIDGVEPTTDSSLNGLTRKAESDPIAIPNVPMRAAIATPPMPAAAKSAYQDKLLANVEPEPDDKTGRAALPPAFDNTGAGRLIASDDAVLIWP